MSVSDPLIKELKVYTTKLLINSPKPITDSDDNILSFCECIEKILYQGIVVQKNVIGLLRTPECWSWLEQLGNEKLGCPYSYISCVEKVKRCDKVTTLCGKVRLLIRNALVRRCIHVPIQILTHSAHRNSIYSPSSIIGDEILSQLLLSVLLLVSKLEFKLDIDNALFLDTTWHLPKAISLQLVPCTTLGLSIMFVSGKALIINVMQDSVASESGDIMIGDILDTLNGVVLCDSMQGSLVNILRRAAGQPITLYIIKGVLNGEIYPPILPLLSQASVDPISVLLQYKKASEANLIDDPDSKITFIGTIDTGEKNDVKQIFIAINLILKSKCSENIDVFIDCHDLGIKVIDKNTKKVMMEHAYMEISSCGCSTNSPYYFAYIAGDGSYCKCKQFKCFIFHCKNRVQIDTLLKTIGQGFRRTLYTV
ncbi:hypothetical protein O3M35_011254 [Rhynocoris fuscipes]|uniref:Uncharacterized protein n=1 Tax=Rhynocoris fuscipes TaxID=488301 RepID=A0AAW1CVL4_9HEMI